MPSFRVMRFESSAELSKARSAGSSPLAGSLRKLERNDSSSETKGSSTWKVVGKKRFPAVPWAEALWESRTEITSTPAISAGALRCDHSCMDPPFYRLAAALPNGFGEWQARGAVDGGQ